MIEVRKYRQTRFWAVYVDGDLLAVVVYRKGALAIAERLMAGNHGKESDHAA
jgi:hypothetical protein